MKTWPPVRAVKNLIHHIGSKGVFVDQHMQIIRTKAWTISNQKAAFSLVRIFHFEQTPAVIVKKESVFVEKSADIVFYDQINNMHAVQGTFVIQYQFFPKSFFMRWDLDALLHDTSGSMSVFPRVKFIVKCLIFFIIVIIKIGYAVTDRFRQFFLGFGDRTGKLVKVKIESTDLTFIPLEIIHMKYHRTL